MNKWVIGLSIDEKITLCASQIDDNHQFIKKNPQVRATLSKFSVSQEGKITLERDLRLWLEGLAKKEKFGPIFKEAQAIGVGSIGLVNRARLKLTDIARKDWIGIPDQNGKSDCIIDFNRLFSRDIFPALKDLAPSQKTTRFINIHNDATAKCLSEYHRQTEETKVTSLFYVMVSEGVNGGYVVDGYPMATELHPELGHIWPKLHPSDSNNSFNREHSGCPVHIECFEGVASGARIRKSWNKNLADLGPDYPDDGNHPWHRISYYIAQLCFDATLAIAPARIVIGGPVVFPRLIPVIIKYFDYLNSGGRQRKNGSRWDYLQYPAMEEEGFIQPEGILQDQELWGALELARSIFLAPVRALGLRGKHLSLGRGPKLP